ncbi:MAG: hypothetical protein V3U84_03785, partial [Thiotrichaceae bacterium]
KELLAVLDLPEEEQNRWCCLNTDRKSHESFADLAFRLRREAIRLDNWAKAKKIVHKKREDFRGADGRSFNLNASNRYFANVAEEIDFVITGLIAKSLAKGE